MALALMAGTALWFAMAGTATPAGAATFCAPSETYTTIQAAIDAAGDGDTIRIVYGTWDENLDISDDITLEGGYSKECPTPRTYTDPQYTIIDGGAADHVVSITGGSTVALDGLTLTNGFAQKGGGVYVSGASADLNYVVVASNVISPTGPSTYDWAYGGGVFVENGSISLSNCEITDNKLEPGTVGTSFGGGLALDWVPAGGATAVIQATSITSNTNPSDSNLYGGGLFLDGGGVQVTFEGTDNLLAYNEAKYGGGVYMYGDVDLEGLLIEDNHALNYGGGIFVGSGYHGGMIANNYLVGNTAGQNGPSIFTLDDGLRIANNTIVGTFYGAFAGIDINQYGTGTLEVINNIVVSHTIGIRAENLASVTLSHNDVWNNTTNYFNIAPGSSDISVDPEFVDPDNDDYHLDSDSPCIDAGTAVDGVHLDWDRERRTGTFLDIGADEYPAEYIGFVPGVLKSYSP
jgi:hypothetical protein